MLAMIDRGDASSEPGCAAASSCSAQAPCSARRRANLASGSADTAVAALVAATSAAASSRGSGATPGVA